MTTERGSHQSSGPHAEHGDVALVLEGHGRDLGDGMSVRRVLPAARRKMVGPFIFVDHFGPLQLAAGAGLDVRPHPHIGLATVTYLFDGEILHRDSLGSEQLIRPGAVNWMNAGRGIVHSERSPSAQREAGAKMHGLQLWVALPRDQEESEPSFDHYAAETIPEFGVAGARGRVVAGSMFGVTSPVRTRSALFYVEVKIDAGATLELEARPDERAVYVLSGRVEIDGDPHGASRLLVLHPSRQVRVSSPSGAHLMLLGGEPLDGERHIYWNFVSSSVDRLRQASDDWRARAFPRVPGDETEYIPLPPEGFHPR